MSLNGSAAQQPPSLSHLKRTGSALSEYTLLGGALLVLLVCGFLSVGEHLNGWMQALKREMTVHAGQSKLADARSQAEIANATPGAPLEANAPTQSSTSGSSHTPLSSRELKLLHAKLEERIRTLGPGGATELMAKQLETLAAELLLRGQILPEQGQLLQQLANQGHRLAKIEALLEDTVQKANGDPTALQMLKIRLDGVSYTPMKLYAQIGFHTAAPVDFATQDILQASGTASPETAVFLDLYRKIQTDSALFQIQEIRATVESASIQIATISESVEDTFWNIFDQRIPLPDKDTLFQHVASTSTTMRPREICLAGDFEDNGFSCVK